mgnify:CR=1 FL=1
MGHSGGIDAGMAAACRIGGKYQLSNEVYIKDYFAVCCQDMFGPRFDWRNCPREQAPILKARL